VIEGCDLGLYLVTDRELCLGRPVERIVEAALRGGVSCVQLREKSLPTGAFVEIARSIKSILAPRGVPLIINDRVDVALAADADGVHLGQSDLSFLDARKLLGPGAIIGLSVESMDQALEAEDWGVDYLGVSPILATPTKPEAKAAWGLDGLRRLRRATSHVLIAIGGINPANAAQVLEAGADGLAVVSAICSAPDPENAARRLREAVDRHRSKKLRS
jgi:thiamine-phosphate pyrophosphorylase